MSTGSSARGSPDSAARSPDATRSANDSTPSRAGPTEITWSSFGNPARNALYIAGRSSFSVAGPQITLTAQVTALDGRRQVTGSATGTDPEQLGAALAATLLDQGAGQILAGIRTARA